MDGRLYGGTFRGTNSVNMYPIEFEDGSELTLKREDIWLRGESLPKKVLARLSKATDMKHNNIFEEGKKGDVQTRTRKVTPKYIRDEDFV